MHFPHLGMSLKFLLGKNVALDVHTTLGQHSVPLHHLESVILRDVSSVGQTNGNWKGQGLGCRGGCSKMLHWKDCKSSVFDVQCVGLALLWRKLKIPPLEKRPDIFLQTDPLIIIMLCSNCSCDCYIPCSMNSWWITSCTSQNPVAIPLPAKGAALNFFFHDEVGCFHSTDGCLVSGVKWCTHISMRYKGFQKLCSYEQNTMSHKQCVHTRELNFP